MPLTVEQIKRLYHAFYDRIIELHNTELKNNLINFTKHARNKGRKGIVMLDYVNIDSMIDAVKNKDFKYEWISRNKAAKIKHIGMRNALITMNPSNDCVLVCSLSISLKHLYINCIKFLDIEKL